MIVCAPVIYANDNQQREEESKKNLREEKFTLLWMQLFSSTTLFPKIQFFLLPSFTDTHTLTPCCLSKVSIRNVQSIKLFFFVVETSCVLYTLNSNNSSICTRKIFTLLPFARYIMRASVCVCVCRRRLSRCETNRNFVGAKRNLNDNAVTTMANNGKEQRKVLKFNHSATANETVINSN